MGGGSKTTTSTTVTRTPEEIEYTKQQIELAKQQLALVEEEHGWQSEIYALTKPLLEKYALMVDQDFAEMQSPEYQAMKAKQQQLDTANIDAQLRNLPMQEELLQRQLDEIRRGGAATDEQKRLIKDVADRALAGGETDINRFLGTGLDQIRNQMAPARGMRPDDGPMQEAAQRVLEEAVRQQGQLSQQVRGAQSQAELNFPLAAGQVTNQANQWQAGFNQDMNQFLSGLKTQAVQNRTALMGQLFSAPMTAGDRGLNLVNVSRPNPVNFPQNTTTTQKTSGGSIFGGIGGLLQGVGAVAPLFSSRKAKTNIKPMEAPPGHMLSPGALKQNFNDLSGESPIGPANQVPILTQTVGKPPQPDMPQIHPRWAGPQTVGKPPQPDIPQINPGWAGPQTGGKPPEPDIPQINPGFGGGAMPTVQPPRDEEDALNRLRQLPISSWQYKPETGLGGPTHVGPMAEDFNTIMMGKKPEPFINTVDAVGSLMASVKALDKRMMGLGLGQAKKPRRARAGAGAWR